MRKVFILILFMLSTACLWSQTTLEGQIVDEETKEPIAFANVALYKEGVLKTGNTTDIDGRFLFKNIDPGQYDLEATYIGYQGQKIKDILILAGKSNRIDIKLSSGVLLEELVVVDYEVPLVEQDNTTTGGVVTSAQIKNLPTKNIQTLAATTAGISSIDGESVAIRGSRTNATNYYIDGIRVNANLIPQSEIDQLQVITGGVEAKYGDVTGGIISITTKGPSQRFTGGAEIETSEFLDAFGYNELNANLSGPIYKNSKGVSVLGFRVAGRYLLRKDDHPSFVPHFHIKDGALRDLQDNPVRQVGGSYFASPEFLSNQQISQSNYHLNDNRQNIDITAKLDWRLSKQIDMTFSGGYGDSYNRFQPSSSWAILNYENNPENFGNRYRANVRFRHRIGVSDLDKEAKSAHLRNFTYIINAGIETSASKRQDYRHKDKIFRYGHVGTFDFEWMPVEGESDASMTPVPGVAHIGYRRVLNGPFTPSPYNPLLANYNNHIDQNNFDNYVAYNGFLANTFNNPWSFFQNTGGVYNSYGNSNYKKYDVNLAASFDIFPNKSSSARHSIEMGFSFEQQFSSGWSVAPRNLWLIARQQANKHIIGIDTSVVVGEFFGARLFDQTFPKFQNLITQPEGQKFYQAVRALTGQDIHDYVNVDGINPDDLRLDMFSPLELNDQGIVSYYGVDYLGNAYNRDVTFNDFFTARDENGLRTFPIAGFKPVYGAAWIQDKFNYKDIIFRLGLRVDYYDAKNKVLKDPYSLYPIMTAEDFYSDGNKNRPAGVDDDFKVYVTGKNSDKVKAFRKGDQWYYADGLPANDGFDIYGGEIVYPKYYADNVNDIKSDLFDPDKSFEDYKPVLSWMPRFSVSFPISDKANFFANYDVLVQRPPSNTFTTPLDYYYFEDRNHGAGNPISNPNLKPEKTINYEVGFQRKLSRYSALKINAYYRELRDMLQQRTYLNIASPVSTYTTYGNIDFGTTKGITFSYDLRRYKNISFQGNYTLQFSEGTGSDVNSQSGLTTRGNIRVPYPTNRDERHAIKLTLDYRYGSGQAYNGPYLFDLPILENFGINLQSFIVSGRPYTSRIRPLPFGGSGFKATINGARKPWTYTLDFRADRSFNLVASEEKRAMFLNVSLRILNLLNTQNIRNVYSASGSAYDSGYLASSDGQSAIRNVNSVNDDILAAGRNETAYRDALSWQQLREGFFYSPRRIYLGIRFDF